MASMTTMAVALAGCGFADSHAVLPDFMRTKVSEAPLQPVPDVKQLVREHLDSVFTAASAPRDVQVSPARHDLRGPGWTACVRAELTSATGNRWASRSIASTSTRGSSLTGSGSRPRTPVCRRASSRSSGNGGEGTSPARNVAPIKRKLIDPNSARRIGSNRGSYFARLIEM